jgi:hypothetical protein
MDSIKAVPLPDFESIDILAENADFILVGGQYTAFELLNPHSIPLVYEVKDQKLSLIQKEAGPRVLIELHLKHDTILSFLRLHSLRGDISLEHLEIKQAKLHLHQGSLFIKHTDMHACLLEIEQGELCAKKARFDTCRLQQNMCDKKQTK